MVRRALVIGASGLVGSALMRALEEAGWSTSGTANRRTTKRLLSLDITDASAVTRVINEIRPDVVFVAAAYANVDGCEADPARSDAVNIGGATNIAAAVGESRLVYYSTDYIFDGVAGPYSESDAPNPTGVYARGKLAAEQVIQHLTKRHLILRTTWVFGWNRASENFAMQVWRRLGSGEPMRVARDQVANPTLVEYLAEVSLRLVEIDAQGIVNVVGRDRLARDEFARRLARTFVLDPGLIKPVTTSELQQSARRPSQAGLTTERLEKLLGTESMALDEALKRVRRGWRADTYVAHGPVKPSSDAAALKAEILGKVREYHSVVHRRPPFVRGRSRIAYAGRVYGEEELVNVVDAGLDFWLTLGPWGDMFEAQLRDRLGARDAVLVNSGSSANLVAISALLAAELDRPLQPGDEVLTPAVTFPTTIAPLIQNGLTPVLVDCHLPTYNMDPVEAASAVGPKTRAIIAPHTLGNPFDVPAILEIVRQHNLFLIEDACDALGSEYAGQPVGTFGDLATISFYPAHHITMGEGGAVVINRPRLSRLVRSLRDWGRDCWCAPGESNTCGKRFGWKFGGLPEGYDHKYTYTHLGYNLKPTDLQAAIGVAQLQRLNAFVSARRANFERLYTGLKPFEDRFILPESLRQSAPAWFGFPITLREPASRRKLVQWLEDANIETRQLFGGQILKQPGFVHAKVKVHGNLINSEKVMHDTFFIGVFPGLDAAMIDYVLETFTAFAARN